MRETDKVGTLVPGRMNLAECPESFLTCLRLAEFRPFSMPCCTKIVTAFSTTLRNQVDLDQLREQLLAVVQETMQPSHVSLWVRPPQPSGKGKTWPLARIVEEEKDE